MKPEINQIWQFKVTGETIIIEGINHCKGYPDVIQYKFLDGEGKGLVLKRYMNRDFDFIGYDNKGKA